MSIYHSRVEIKFLCPLLQSFGHKNNFISPKKLTRSLRSLVRFNGEIKLFLCPHSFSRGHKNFISPRSWYIATLFYSRLCEKCPLTLVNLWSMNRDVHAKIDTPLTIHASAYFHFFWTSASESETSHFSLFHYFRMGS